MKTVAEISRIVCPMDGLKAFHDEIVGLLLDEARAEGLPPKQVEHIRQLIKYNLFGGKMNRGRAVVEATVAIHKHRGLADVPAGVLRMAYAGAWAVEWLQAALLVADDVMDRSEMRRGRACWYRLDQIGLAAVNDAFILESHVFAILRMFMRSSPNYADILDLVHGVLYRTELGQLLDVQPEQAEEGRYLMTVRFKTSYYSFYLPVALAAALCGVLDAKIDAELKSVLLPMGEYFQAQDDFLDVFGDPAELGKIGTDIQENKCTWLLLNALARSSHEQRSIISANYGVQNVHEPAERVKALYKELCLDRAFKEFENAQFERLKSLISAIDEASSVPRCVYHTCLDSIFQRSK